MGLLAPVKFPVELALLLNDKTVAALLKHNNRRYRLGNMTYLSFRHLFSTNRSFNAGRRVVSTEATTAGW
ncbi:MAG: hypothetical protein ACXV5H_09825 [Halobacteriota archaeon]